MTTGYKRLRLLTAAAPVTSLLLAQAGRATDVHWLSAQPGNWTDSIKWSSQTYYPTNGTLGTSDYYAVFVDPAGAPYTLRANGVFSVNTLDLAANARLDIGNNHSLKVLFGMNIDGEIHLASQAGGSSKLTLGDYNSTPNTPFITGNGSIVFDSTGGETRVETFKSSFIPVLPAGLTVRTGSGSGSWTVPAVSHASFIADTPGQTLFVTAPDFHNMGTMRVANGATLRLGGDYFKNFGQIVLEAGGTLDLGVNGTNAAGVTLEELGTITRTGGTLNLLSRIYNVGRTFDLSSAPGPWLLKWGGGFNGGTVRASDGSPLIVLNDGGPAQIIDAALEADTVVEPGARLWLERVTLLDSTVSIRGSTGPFTQVELRQPLRGAGEVVFDGPGDQSWLYNGEIGAGISVRTGENGGKVRYTLNRGSLTAQGGKTLIVETVNNFGTMRAITGGTLQLDGNISNRGPLLADDATIRVNGIFGEENGSRISLTNSTMIVAGQVYLRELPAMNQSTLQFLPGSSIEVETFNPSGSFELSTGMRFKLRGAINMAGHSIILNSGTTGAAMLEFAQSGVDGTPQAFDNGTIVFDGQDDDDLVRFGSFQTFTIGEDATVRTGRSGGTLGESGAYLFNQGRVISQTAGKTLNVLGSQVTNQGIFEARNGGTLQLPAAIFSIVDSTLRGGTYIVRANSAMTGPTAFLTMRSRASILLDGPNTSFPLLNNLYENFGSFTLDTGNVFTVGNGFGGLVNHGAVSVLGGSELHIPNHYSGTGTTTIGNGALLIARNISQDVLRVDGIARIRPGTAGATAAIYTKLLLMNESAGAPLGTLDVAETGLVIDYTAASPFEQTLDTVRNAYQPAAEAHWLGTGITSSAATNSTSLGLGIGEASTVLGLSGTQTANWLGRSVDATSVLVRLTKLGDTNLDGSVNFVDLLKVAANFGRNESLWPDGDFNYDGSVNFTDLLGVAANFGGSVPAGALDGDFAAAWAAAQSQVPEPASLVALGASYLLLSRRRVARPARS